MTRNAPGALRFPPDVVATSFNTLLDSSVQLAGLFETKRIGLLICNHGKDYNE